MFTIAQCACLPARATCAVISDLFFSLTRLAKTIRRRTKTGQVLHACLYIHITPQHTTITHTRALTVIFHCHSHTTPFINTEDPRLEVSLTRTWYPCHLSPLEGRFPRSDWTVGGLNAHLYCAATPQNVTSHVTIVTARRDVTHKQLSPSQHCGCGSNAPTSVQIRPKINTGQTRKIKCVVILLDSYSSSEPCRNIN
ncbi:hypothetical protein J6590_062743 [Homalodisca vitripennis]|nr:hypothetical protein J6590_062743 [Homalodisca vitripennis]